MNRTELIGHLQSKYAMTAEEVKKIESDGEKLIKTAFDFAGFKPDVDIRELVDGALEFKDKAYSGKWDWIDWGCTVAGVIVGYGIRYGITKLVR